MLLAALDPAASRAALDGLAARFAADDNAVSAAREGPEQLAADLVPHDAGEGWAAPQVAAGEAAAGAASTRGGGGLVVYQDDSQCGDSAGVLPGPL